MGHYCRICGRQRANKHFSGRGQQIHVCKQCNAKPKSEQRAIEHKDDTFGFIHQSRMFEKNLARLEQLTKSENPKVASLAAIVMEAAGLTPEKIRRLDLLAQKDVELMQNWEDDELEALVREDFEATDSSAQEDWDIPF